MIQVSDTIKNLYKANDREIKCYGELYFKERRMSNNLLNTDNYVSKSNLEYIGRNDTSIHFGTHYMFYKTTNEEATEIGFKYKIVGDENFVDGETFPISTKEIRVHHNGAVIEKIMIYFNTESDTNVIFNIPELLRTIDGYFTFGLTIENIYNEIGFSHIFIARWWNILEYEPYNEIVSGLAYKQVPGYIYCVPEHLTLSAENNTEILSFDLDLKTDVYYTSLPYNTLEIEINNEVGYFADYDEDSITNKLNSDCFINLYLQIVDGENTHTFKLMTMNFDKISYSDYEKAKLEFKSCLSYIQNLKLRDKYLDFTDENYNIVISRYLLSKYLESNYNIKMTYPQDAVSSDNYDNSKMFSVQDMILNAGTHLLDWSGNDPTIHIGKAVLTTNNSNDEIALRKLVDIVQESITKDYELEKPTMKRENSYDRLKYTYEEVSWATTNYEQTNATYKKTITGTLSSTQENILLIDNDYKINDITTNDITIEGWPTVSVPQGQYNPRMIVISINGNIGNEYTLTIEKANIYKKKNRSIKELNIGNKNETAKTLEIKENSPVYSDYFQVILYDNRILSNVEVKLMALPYLELGDTIAVQVDNAYITMIISEINLSFGDGLIQTIKGYRLGWLYPSTTLYPSDDLYPNMPDKNKI